MTAAPSGPRHSRRVAAALAVVTSSLGVLLVERRDRRPPWSFPGGHIEPGETAALAAVRWVPVPEVARLLPGLHPPVGAHLMGADRPESGR